MQGTLMVVATIPVTDLDRAREFYRDKLGLEVLWENPASIRFSGGGGSELSVFKRGPSTADHTKAHFELSDIEAVVRDLEAKGVEFLDYEDGPLQTVNHIARIGPARGAWIKDPDGNILGLRQAD
jgi:catechol 2,3-dioxygenase-like lactoylglutathione lyase family enzyme